MSIGTYTRVIKCRSGSFNITLPKNAVREAFGNKYEVLKSKKCMRETGCKNCDLRTGGIKTEVVPKPEVNGLILYLIAPIREEKASEKEKTIIYKPVSLTEDEITNIFKCSFIAGYSTVIYEFEPEFKRKSDELFNKAESIIDLFRGKGLLENISESRITEMIEKKEPDFPYYPFIFYKISRLVPEGIEVPPQFISDGKRWGIKIEPRKDELELSIKEFLKAMYHYVNSLITSFKDCILRDVKPENIDEEDNYVDILWMIITRLILKKLYSLQIVGHIDKPSFDSPIGLFYAQAISKTAERLCDKLVVASYYAYQLRKEGILLQEDMAKIVEDISKFLKEVTEYALDLDMEIKYEEINKIRKDYEEILKAIRDLEEKMIENADKDKNKITVAKLFTYLENVLRNILSIFSWRNTVRSEEVMRSLVYSL